MTTYIAGPMTGIPEFNYPAFKAVAAQMRSQGVDVRSPAVDDPPADYTPDQPYTYFLRRGLRMLLECDAIVLLPGWEQSRGARLERDIALALGMEVTLWLGATA